MSCPRLGTVMPSSFSVARQNACSWFIGATVQKADVRVDALDDFTVELQYEAQYAVSRRMLGPKIEGEVAQGCFGHNGLASAAGSTLAADAGSRSIGFQFHRADVIDGARTGSTV